MIRKDEEAAEEEKPAHKDWTEQEVGLIVADYFDILEAELLGKSFKKSDHRKPLAPKLLSRSDGSIEFKHQNVSGVLVELGLPYIEGYKPRSNYQGILATEVESFLDTHPGFLEKLAAAPTLNPVEVKQIATPDLEQIIEDPPEKTIAPTTKIRPWLSRKARKIDFAEIDAVVLASSASNSCSIWSGIVCELPGGMILPSESCGLRRKSAMAWASTSSLLTTPTIPSESWRSRRPASANSSRSSSLATKSDAPGIFRTNITCSGSSTSGGSLGCTSCRDRCGNCASLIRCCSWLGWRVALASTASPTPAIGSSRISARTCNLICAWHAPQTSAGRLAVYPRLPAFR